jgi:hypothetical protein
MTKEKPAMPDPETLSAGALTIASLEDEIRVDRLCVEMIRAFGNAISARTGERPEQVGRLCHGADYFLREFVIADRRENLLQISGRRIRQFGGHWYIVRTLEPNMTELGSILDGIAAFYPYLAERAIIDRERAADICAACAEREWYRQRIEAFRAIEGDGYFAWRDEVHL